jgi:hypothetical protein
LQGVRLSTNRANAIQNVLLAVQAHVLHLLLLE